MNLSQKLKVNPGDVASRLALLPNYSEIGYSTRVEGTSVIVELNDEFGQPFVETQNGEAIKLAVKSIMSEDTNYSIVNSLVAIFSNFTLMEEKVAKKLSRFLQDVYKKFSYDSFDMEIDSSTRFVFLNLSNIS